MELLKVKEETNNWVNEVRQELNQIEEDNKKLKATVAELSKSGQTENKVTPATVSAKSNSDNGNRVFISILIILLAILSAVAFYYFITTNKKEIVATPEGIKKEAEAPPAISNPVNADTVSINQDSLATPAVSDTVAKEEIAPLSEPANKMNTPVHIETKTYKTASEFVLTEAKLRKDLIKKKISGCDIVINKASEIETISHLVLVEKLPSGQLKYKFTATIVKGSDTFTAIPYVYYKTSGIFIKIDGTNCE